MTTALPATPSTGSVAQTHLAGDAAAALQWLRVLTREDGPAEVAAALDAMCCLRTALRSLRPILDKEWTVALRDGLDPLTDALTRVHELDGQVQLLQECRAADDAIPRALLADLAAERVAVVATLGDLLDPGTDAALAFLASGREPAPLRADAPVGDPTLPASVLMPPMLHRRWRKLVRETPVADLVAMRRRAAELIVVIEVATRLDLPVIELWPPTDELRSAATAALRVAGAAALADRLPGGPTRSALVRITAQRAWVTHDVVRAQSALARLGHLLPADDQGPAKVAAGGLVVRTGPAGPEVLLVHRVRHDDWSLPKGATAPGESPQEAAVREVREETGLRCRLGQELRPITYRDRNNRVKRVRFWHMTPLGEAGRPCPAEVDETRWVPLADAAGVLTRKRDRVVVVAFGREHLAA